MHPQRHPARGVLGPLIWNLMFDDLLDMFDGNHMFEGLPHMFDDGPVHIKGIADDAALMWPEPSHTS